MKCVTLLSGGLDSTVLAAHLLDGGWEVRCLSVDYGQRHRRELSAAAEVAERLGLEHAVADLSSLASFLPGSSQTDESVAVPAGHYADPSMKATVVPNRNMILLAVAAGHAIAHGADTVAYAAHAGDHPIYPDCRPAFMAALGDALALCHYAPVSLFAPFATWSKAAIVARGATIGAPLALTWSCYRGGERHCGECGTCVERREAFELAKVPDQTGYAAQ